MDPPVNLSVAFGVLLFASAAVRASPNAATAMNPVIRRIPHPSFRWSLMAPSMLGERSSQLPCRPQRALMEGLREAPRRPFGTLADLSSEDGARDRCATLPAA